MLCESPIPACSPAENIEFAPASSISLPLLL